MRNKEVKEVGEGKKLGHELAYLFIGANGSGQRWKFGPVIVLVSAHYVDCTVFFALDCKVKWSLILIE